MEVFGFMSLKMFCRVCRPYHVPAEDEEGAHSSLNHVLFLVSSNVACVGTHSLKDALGFLFCSR